MLVGWGAAGPSGSLGEEGAAISFRTSSEGVLESWFALLLVLGAAAVGTADAAAWAFPDSSSISAQATPYFHSFREECMSLAFRIWSVWVYVSLMISLMRCVSSSGKTRPCGGPDSTMYSGEVTPGIAGIGDIRLKL